ncbi:MAG: hypothetical protein Q8P27_00455 [Candidatus Peregrinibacteria bacterium]|nr:hypothetical protein [Candidatus Peregrinibacteria bacterium]
MEPVVKLAIYTPVTHSDSIRKVLAESGAGHIGNYDSCSFSTRGVGRFRGLEGSNPAIGEAGQLESVDEEQIETVCYEKDLITILAAVKKVHPYEEPAIDIYPLLNHKYL